MTEITHFVLDPAAGSLAVTINDKETFNYGYEYLRVLSPNRAKGKPGAVVPPVSHKKQVKLLTVEAVGKHGYRLCFDDQHQAIYSPELLIELAKNHDVLWQAYLDELKSTGHSREAMIDITQVN